VEQLLQLIAEHKPDVVIALGQAEGRSQISLERVAINCDDARIADNAGFMPVEQPIKAGGPDGYFTTLPIRELLDTLSKAGTPAGISNSAGTFVCNHLFYSMQDFLSGTDVMSGFIHVPLIPEQLDEFPGQPTMPLSEMKRGISAVIDYLAS
jgi:pyroglutamyl-peptidase